MEAPIGSGLAQGLRMLGIGKGCNLQLGLKSSPSHHLPHFRGFDALQTLPTEAGLCGLKKTPSWSCDRHTHLGLSCWAGWNRFQNKHHADSFTLRSLLLHLCLGQYSSHLYFSRSMFRGLGWLPACGCSDTAEIHT